MEQTFSIVTLLAKSGEKAQFFASGVVQDGYDVLFLKEAKDFFAHVEQAQWARVRIHSYAFGVGAPVPADDLVAVSRDFDRLKRFEMLRDLGEKSIVMNWAHILDENVIFPREEELPAWEDDTCEI